MSRGGLRRLGGLLGPAVVLALGCGSSTAAGDASAGTDSTTASQTSGGASSSTAASTGSSGSSTTTSAATGTTAPPCDPIQLADVALGVGGFVLDGEAEGDTSGFSVSGAGDVDGDGLADVIVGAPTGDPNDLVDSGRSYVVFGKADTESVLLAGVALGIGGFALDGEAEVDVSGVSVSGVGDVNGDGRADVAVGAHLADPNGLDRSGRSYVVFGKEGAAAVSLADIAAGIGGFAMDGEGEYDYAGWPVSGAGDVNGDGLADVIVGAWRAAPNGPFSGRVYVVFGKADTERVSLADVGQGTGGFALDGEGEYDFAGSSASGAGDVNGDGLDDVIVGASLDDPNGVHNSGRSYVVFGKADTDRVLLADVALGIGGFILDGEAEDDHSGDAVSGAGDVNGDGLADVVVGAYGATLNGDYSGRTYVVFGKVETEGVQLADVAGGIGGFAIDGEAAGDWSGRSVSGAGDVNGDGVPDVVVGAHGADPNGDQSGRTYVVFGKVETEGVQLAEVAQGTGGFAIDGEAAEDWSGRSVNGGGDVNGDGIPDIIVGAYRAGPNGPDSGRSYVVFGGDFSCAGG